MPLEIKEITITASVTENTGESGSAGQGGSAMGNQDDVIAACVEQVMEILKEKSER